MKGVALRLSACSAGNGRLVQGIKGYGPFPQFRKYLKGYFCFKLPVGSAEAGIANALEFPFSLWMSVSSYGCNNKLPHIGLLKATAIYSLTVQRAKNLKSRCR